MLKYVGWIIRLIFPLVTSYPWIFRMSRNPEKYPLAYRYNKVRILALKFLRIVKADAYVVNAPKFVSGQKFYFVGNHVSLLDPVVLLANSETPITFASKIEVAKFPFVGRILKVIDGVFLERDNLKQEIRVMQNIKKSLAAGTTNWALFPEGTRNKDYFRAVGEFKAGSFKLPVVTNTTIIPLAIWGTQPVLTTKIKWRRYPIYMHFLDPIEPTLFNGNTIKIAQYTQEMIQNEVNKMREEFTHQTRCFSKGQDFTKHLQPKSTNS